MTYGCYSTTEVKLSFFFVLFPILVFVTGALHIINVQLFWKLMSYNGHLFVPIDL